MMNSIFLFVAKSSLCAAVFFLYYLVLLKKTRTYQFNRWYLLSAVLFSVTLPLLDINSLFGSYAPAARFSLMPVIASSKMETERFSHGSGGYSYSVILTNLYYIVAVLMTAMSVAKIVWLACIRHFGTKYSRDGVRFVETSLISGPFSFMNTIYWPAHLSLNSPEGERIVAHELAHIRQGHTFDKLIVQIILCLCWLNPVLWLIRRELWLQHEFIADEAAIENNDTESFARMLLYAAYKSGNMGIVNFFYHSPIKRRLNMLLNNHTGAGTKLRRFCSPLVLLLPLFLLSFSFRDKAAPKTRANKKVVMVLDAGHGGKDKGATDASGRNEKDITLAICKEMEHLAGEYNIEVIPIRTKDEDVVLSRRVNTSNNAAADIYLSVHIAKNKPQQPGANNYKLGISTKNTNYQSSRSLASAIAGRLKSIDISADVADYSKVFVISKSVRTAVLLECGNIEDQSNMIHLQNNEKLEQMCRSVLSGIVDYQQSK